MSRRRCLHQHEVFEFRNRLLALLHESDHASWQEQPQLWANALDNLWPLLLLISHWERRWWCNEALCQQGIDQSLEDSVSTSAAAFQASALAELRVYRDQLLQWSEVYLNASQWQRIQDSLRQRRRSNPPNRLTRCIQQRLNPAPAPGQPRWSHPLKEQDRFASRLLVPKPVAGGVAPTQELADKSPHPVSR